METVSKDEYQRLLEDHRRLMEENQELLKDYQPLLFANRVLGLQLLSRNIQDLERKMGQQFAKIRRDPRVDDLEAQIGRLKERLQTQDERQHKRMTAMEESQVKARQAYGELRDALQKPPDPESGEGE